MHEGESYGRLTVVRGDIISPDTGKTMAQCVCSCGNEVTKSVSDIRRGNISSCGCYQKEAARKRLLSNPKRYTNTIIEMSVGDVFGYLTVIDETPIKRGVGKNFYYRCLCICGKKVTAQGTALRKGTQKSCGCIRESLRKDMNAGDKYGTLTILSKIPKKQGRRLFYKCVCECGMKVEADGSRLRRGQKSHDGCILVDNRGRDGKFIKRDDELMR